MGHTRALLVLLLVAACGDGGYDSGYDENATVASLAESDRAAACESSIAWIATTVGQSTIDELAIVTQSLASTYNVEACEAALPVYEGFAPYTVECDSAMLDRFAACEARVGQLEEFVEWTADDIAWQASELSCELAATPMVWSSIAYGAPGRVPPELVSAYGCLFAS